MLYKDRNIVIKTSKSAFYFSMIGAMLCNILIIFMFFMTKPQIDKYLLLVIICFFLWEVIYIGLSLKHRDTVIVDIVVNNTNIIIECLKKEIEVKKIIKVKNKVNVIEVHCIDKNNKHYKLNILKNTIGKRVLSYKDSGIDYGFVEVLISAIRIK